MGSQATVLIRTDALSTIKNNAQEFVDNMLLAIESVAVGAAPKDFPAGNHGNPAQVINYHHNDTTSVVVLGGGRGQELAQIYNHGRWDSAASIAVRVIETLLDKYRLSKKVRDK